MKRRITKEEVIVMIKELDTRCKKWDVTKFDRVINNGFAELCTVIQPFVSQVNVNLQEYYDLGESRFDINLTGDTLSVYDLYLSKAADSFNVWKHDEEKCRDEDVIWKDPVNSDVVHVDMTKDIFSRTFEDAVVKYFYVPTADFDELYMSSDVYLALESAIAAVSYDMLHDVEKASQQRSAFTRKGGAILEIYPGDYSDPGKPSMFPPGV
ncbi:MAG: hypothetical protein DRH37_07420 [Deltaproteobacteria bacterium]|nr:MAG: hypothetical protein DRH37_07420 [Deltaproteobacteria bacterium]